MKTRFHDYLQLALIGAMALVVGDFICLAQSAMAQKSVQPPAGYFGGIPLYPPTPQPVPEPKAKKPVPKPSPAARPGDKQLEGDLDASFGPKGAGAKTPATSKTKKAAESTKTKKTGPGKMKSAELTSPAVSVPAIPGSGPGPTSPEIKFPTAVKTPEPPPDWYKVPPELVDIFRRLPPEVLRRIFPPVPPGPYQETMEGYTPPVGPVGDIYGEDEAIERFRRLHGPMDSTEIGVPGQTRYTDPAQAKALEEAWKQGAKQVYDQTASGKLKTIVKGFQTANQVFDDMINTDSLAPAGREVQKQLNEYAVDGAFDQLRDKVKPMIEKRPGAKLADKGIDKLADAAKDVVKYVEDEIMFRGQDFKAPGPAPPGPDGMYDETISPYLKK